MEKIVIDAKQIMEAAEPAAACARLFGLETGQAEELRMQLQTADINRIVEVLNWKEAPAGWEVIADLLEGVQQHSSYFYLIWGTADDYVNVHAANDQNVLINPPLQ